MLRKLFWCVLAWVVVFPMSACAGDIAVTVAEQSIVRRPVLTLGDIAVISGDDSAKVQAFRAARLGIAPAPGSSFQLTRDSLGARLADSGVDFTGVVWKVPDLITVAADSQTISGQNLVNAGLAAIRSQMGASANREGEIVALVRPQDVVLPVGKASVTAELPFGIRPGLPVIVNVNISVDDKLVSKAVLRFAVKSYRLVVVAARPVMPHEVLTVDSVRYERMDVGRLASGYITDINQVVGKMARHQLVPGTVINGFIIGKPLLIVHGSSVTILSRVGGIEATAPGVALQDGALDQVIRVVNTNSKRTLTARVLDGNTVLVSTYEQ